MFLGQNALTMEGQAFFHALLIALSLGFDKIFVEVDCVDLYCGNIYGSQMAD